VAKQKPRILFIDQYSLLGGGQMVLLQLLGICSRNGFEAKVLAPGGGDFEAAVKTKFPGVEFVSVEELGLSQGKKNLIDKLKVLFSVRKFLKHRKHFQWADVVYVNGPRYALAAANMSFYNQAKYIYHIHLDHSAPEKKLIHWISRLKKTHKVILASEYIGRQMGALSDKFVVQSNSLPNELYRLPFIDRWSGKKKITAVCIGRLAPEKGQLAIVHLAEKFPEVNFIMIGSSDFQSKAYENELRAHPPRNALFFGKTQNLRTTLDRLAPQISIVPSVWEEPFGLVAIESTACSLLTITSGRGELENISKKTGCLIAEDEKKLELTLNKVLSMNDGERIGLAQRQHKLVNEVYSPAEYEKRWLALLNP
jgi:glycosyltransferase involved in cell wall biosynthesis